MGVKVAVSNIWEQIKSFIKGREKILQIIICAVCLSIVTLIVILSVSCGENGLDDKSADTIVRKDWAFITSESTAELETENAYNLEDFGVLSSDKPISDVSSSDVLSKTDTIEPTFLSMIDQRSYFKLERMEKNEDYYVLSYSVTSPDLKSALSSISETDIVDAASFSYDEFMINIVSGSDMMTTEAVVIITRENGEYRVTYSEEFVDAMYGGLYTYSLEMMQELYGDTENSEDMDMEDEQQ